MLFKDGQMSFSLGPPSGRPLEQHNPRNQVRMDSFECLEILIKKRERERNLNIKVPLQRLCVQGDGGGEGNSVKRRKARMQSVTSSRTRLGSRFGWSQTQASKCQETASKRLKVQALDKLVLILGCYIRKNYSSSISYIHLFSKMGILARCCWWGYMR